MAPSGEERRGAGGDGNLLRPGCDPRCATPGRLLLELPELFPFSDFSPKLFTPTRVFTHNTVLQTILLCPLQQQFYALQCDTHSMNTHTKLREDMNAYGKMPPSLPVPFLASSNKRHRRCILWH